MKLHYIFMMFLQIFTLLCSCLMCTENISKSNLDQEPYGKLNNLREIDIDKKKPYNFMRLKYIFLEAKVVLKWNTYMNGNVQSVKRPFSGHEIILCDTLLWAPGPILIAPDSFYLTNSSSGRLGSHIGGPNTENTYWYLPPQSRQLVAL